MMSEVTTEELMARIATLERSIAEIRAAAEKALDLHDDFPDDLGGPQQGGWPGFIYVAGKLYDGLTDGTKPYVKVIMSSVPTVEETADAFPDPMPPNEEWIVKADHKDPIHITRF